MAHKKSLLGKYFSESDCRSPRHDGHNWLTPETSLSDPPGEDRSGKTTEVMKSGSTSTDTNVTIKSGSTTPDSDDNYCHIYTCQRETPTTDIFQCGDNVWRNLAFRNFWVSRQKQSPSKSPDSSPDDILNANLQTMRNTLQHSQ